MHGMISFASKAPWKIHRIKRLLHFGPESCSDISHVLLFFRAPIWETDQGILYVPGPEMVHQQYAMVSLAANDAIWADETVGYGSGFWIRHQESTIIAAIPIQSRPSVEEIVCRLPSINLTGLLYEFAVHLAGHDHWG